VKLGPTGSFGRDALRRILARKGLRSGRRVFPRLGRSLALPGPLRYPIERKFQCGKRALASIFRPMCTAVFRNIDDRRITSSLSGLPWRSVVWRALDDIVLRYTVSYMNLSRKQAMGTDGYAHYHESWTGWDIMVRVPDQKPWVKGSHAY